MKKITKILLLIVICVGIFTLTGCNKKKETNKITLKLNTEGLGQVIYYISEENRIDFDDETPSQSVVLSVDGKTTLTINAKADDGWKFVKWMKDNKEYSKESKVEITLTKDVEYIAVFEAE